MDIASGIAAVTQGLGIAKALRGIEKSYDEVTFKAKIAEVIEALTDAKLALAEAKDGLGERDREIERLKAAFEAKAALVTGDGGYSYLADDSGKPLGYPICPKCEQVNGRIMQTKEHEHSGKSRCPACSDVYTPVVCYLPQDSGYVTKQDKESAEWSAVMRNSSSRASYL